MQYNYPAAPNNNSKACLATDAVTGEQVVYSYDSLNRLSSALAYTFSGTPSTGCTQTTGSTATWTESYALDGFGNLTNKIGTKGGPNVPIGVNPTNNQITDGAPQYDANGNLTAQTGVSCTYDPENRMTYFSSVSNGNRTFGYDSQNKRILNWTGSTDQYGNASGYSVYYYGVKGERLGVYTFSTSYWAGTKVPTLQNAPASTETFFGARRLAPLDRLGSARSVNNTASSYYPFGEDKSTNPAIDAWKFGTYWSDSASGLDYAVNRYYSSSLGRFLTADKYVNSAGPGRPGSWNRYAYVGGDPTNAGDPDGLDATAEQCIENPTYCEGSTAPGNQDSDTSCTGSVTDGFEPTPSPNCSMTFPIPMPPVLSPFRCDISLWYQSAGFEGDPFVHTFINVSVNDVVSNSTTVTDLEAGPSKGFGGYLNVLNDPQTTISGLTTSQGTNTYPTNATELFATGYGASWCAMATLLIELAQSYPQNTYGYSKPYNSNSFTYSLFQYADVSVPVWAQWILLHPALMDVPTAVGWGFLIPSWLVI